MMNLNQFGTRIRERREKCRLKQSDVAAALQVSPQAVSKWERGENAPDISLLPALGTLLGVSVDWLLGAHEEHRDLFEATVLFSGVQNAREMSETLSPRDFASWTNGVCYQVTQAVLQYDGVPIKYNGPGILCFFSGIEHQKRAVLASLCAKASSTTQLKIGMATGTIYLGTIGHPEYASPDIMGETVSIARLTAGWAAGNTESGIAATSLVLANLTNLVSIDSEQQVQFTGISQPITVCQIKC
ncbi:MAG: helix-turn-helix domain-containing protein [Phycisphaerae bacterium]|nr:helix-turn-helix domain-containing protein [Phycisphaerae bacterium]